MAIKIYRITNRINGKKYVGQTSRTLARRFLEHANNLKYAIGQAMQKYGIENFAIELIEVCETREQANDRERYWIAFYDCIAPHGYNLTDGGGACAFSEQAHRNMSAGQKRRYSNPAEHEKSSGAQKKRAQTPEGKAELLAASAKAKELADVKRREQGGKRPPKFAKMSEAAKRRAATPEGHADIMKAVAKSVASRAAKCRKSTDKQ